MALTPGTLLAFSDVVAPAGEAVAELNLLPSLIVLVTSVWVLVDSRAIGVAKGQIKGFFNMGPTGWFISCLLCWIVAFPAYLVKRREYQRAAVAAVTAGPVDSGQELDLMSQLGALADHYSQGRLTEADFQAKKKQLVQRMLDQ